jgi:hypothetical protein
LGSLSPFVGLLQSKLRVKTAPALTALIGLWAQFFIAAVAARVADIRKSSSSPCALKAA